MKIGILTCATLILFSAATASSEPEFDVQTDENFPEVARCLFVTNFATEVWNDMLTAFATDPSESEELNLDAFGDLVIHMDDQRNDLAGRIASIAMANSWSKDQLAFKLNAATAATQGRLTRKASEAIESGEFDDALEFSGSLLLESIKCQQDLLVDDIIGK